METSSSWNFPIYESFLPLEKDVAGIRFSPQQLRCFFLKGREGEALSEFVHGKAPTKHRPPLINMKSQASLPVEG